jgi:hypothetical protein
MLQKLFIFLLIVSNIVIAETTPVGLSQTEWQNIQNQINQKSLPQTHAVLDQTYLKASNVDANTAVGDGGDQFGSSVAIDGDTLVVGAKFEDGTDDGFENNSGAAYVFVKNNGVWVQQALLKASNVGNGDNFGYSVDISGNTIVVGARDASGSTMRSGLAYVFTRNSTTWSEQAILEASNPGLFDRFGIAVAIDGDTIVVGASEEDGDDSGTQDKAGAAYIFTRTGTSWSSATKITAITNFAAQAKFGYSVDIVNNIIIIGANNEGGSGAAYIFILTAGSWIENEYIKPVALMAGDRFGESVGISGNTVAIGANGDDSFTGSVYVFVKSGGSLSQQANFKANNFDFGDSFGNSISISGDKIVVGAYRENGNGIDGEADNSLTNSGAAYLFTRSGTTWTQQAYLKASNTGDRDVFGSSVSISADSMVVSAPDEDSAIVDDPNDNTFASSTVPFILGAGAAYVFTPPDLMFSNGFEAPVVVKLFQYLAKLQANTTLDQYPVYDSHLNSLVFYGHTLRLKNNTNKQDIVEIVKFWLHEVLIEEGLSGQYGLDVIL